MTTDERILCAGTDPLPAPDGATEWAADLQIDDRWHARYHPSDGGGRPRRWSPLPVSAADLHALWGAGIYWLRWRNAGRRPAGMLRPVAVASEGGQIVAQVPAPAQAPHAPRPAQRPDRTSTAAQPTPAAAPAPWDPRRPYPAPSTLPDSHVIWQETMGVFFPFFERMSAQEQARADAHRAQTEAFARTMIELIRSERDAADRRVAQTMAQIQAAQPPPPPPDPRIGELAEHMAELAERLEGDHDPDEAAAALAPLLEQLQAAAGDRPADKLAQLLQTPAAQQLARAAGTAIMARLAQGAQGRSRPHEEGDGQDPG